MKRSVSGLNNFDADTVTARYLHAGQIACDSIAVDTITADSITLETSGGTATPLSFYEEYSHTTKWKENGGSETESDDMIWTINRIGKNVTLSIPAFLITMTDSVTISTTVALPTRFRPASGFPTFVIRVRNNSTVTYTTGILYFSSGVATLYASVNNGPFTNGNTAGLPGAVNVNWVV